MGLFDQNVDPTEGISLEPSPALDPMLASVMPQAPMAPPPLERPTPPQAPAPAGGNQKMIAMALLGLAAGLGPRHGGGMAAGLLVGQHQNNLDRQTQFRNDQTQYQQQEQNYLREEAIRATQARADAMLQQRRQQALQQALGSIRTEVKTLSTKADYDKRVEGYAAILQRSGYRLDANWLRQAIPFVAPSGKQKAETALAAFFKNPLTQQQLKDDPNAVANGSMSIDLNDDGIPEVVPIRKVMEAAGQSVLADDKGNPVSLSPGPQGGMPQIKLTALLAQFKAENRRDPTPKEMVTLVTEAQKTPKEPKEPSLQQVTDIDPDTGEIVTSLVPKTVGEVSRKPAKEPNQAQFQAGAYAGRMEQSALIIDQLEPAISGMSLFKFKAFESLPPAAQSGPFQSYDQASRNFINAVLRKESGAAISASEFDNARKQYLPQPGDTPQTLKQKKANRDYAFQTMKAAAGRGYQEPITPPVADPAASGRSKLEKR